MHSTKLLQLVFEKHALMVATQAPLPVETLFWHSAQLMVPVVPSMNGLMNELYTVETRPLTPSSVHE
jgi:hypothetical protein